MRSPAQVVGLLRFSGLRWRGCAQDTGGTTIPYTNSNSYPDPNRFYGQAVYAFGREVDQPVSIPRYSYTDTDVSTQVTWTGTQSIVPFWARDGQPALGAFADGVVDKAFNGGSSCVPLVSGPTRCYLISWAGSRTAYDLQAGTQGSTYWHGSLLEGKRGQTGMDYRRNRYL